MTSYAHCRKCRNNFSTKGFSGYCHICETADYVDYYTAKKNPPRLYAQPHLLSSPAPAGGDIDTDRDCGHCGGSPSGCRACSARYLEPKLRYDLIPPLALQECAKGWTAGGAKYDDNTWRSVGKSERIAKIMRHLELYRMGEERDTETNTHHLACVANNAMMLCEKDVEKSVEILKKIFGEPTND